MSQTFVRCPHCSMPHLANETTCNVTGKALSTRPVYASPLPPHPPPIPRASPPPFAHPASSSLSAQIPVGSLLENKYEIVSRLGQGGMGTVYEAVHRDMRRMVAVKVLSRRQASKRDALKRFHHEAQAAAAIGHPNICEVYDFGKLDDGRPFIVMERLYGVTLADRIAAEGALPFEDTIAIIGQVLLGLEAAHAKRLVHRDIKPENVFLCQRPGNPTIVKLLDFGVSKFVDGAALDRSDEDLSLTRTGIVMGTPYYMSPEQARGERKVDSRVDIYACGVMLYEALTGKRPLSANNYNALMVDIVMKEPPAASTLRPALPLAFDRVIATAMAKSRDRRYPSAEQFREALIALRDKTHLRAGGAGGAVGEALEQGPEPTEPCSHEPEENTDVDLKPRFVEESSSDVTTHLYKRGALRKPPP
jgi:serine/threonine-protein kinase